MSTNEKFVIKNVVNKIDAEVQTLDETVKTLIKYSDYQSEHIEKLIKYVEKLHTLVSVHIVIDLPPFEEYMENEKNKSKETE